jgi:ribosome maturation factor RimP
MEEHYTLEVSSPGLDRHLKTDRDFERVLGQILEVNMYEPVDGKRYLAGRLLGMTKETIVLESEGISTQIPRDRIAMARLKLEF